MFVLFKKIFVICPNVCSLISLITQVIICDQKHLTWSRWYASDAIYVTATSFLFLLFRFLLCSVTSAGLFDCHRCFRRSSSCLACILYGRFVLKGVLWWWLISWLALRHYWTRKCCYKLNVSNWSCILYQHAYTVDNSLDRLVRVSVYISYAIQWNPVNTDTNGTCPSVRINGVSVLSGLSEKTLQTHVLSKKRP